MAARKANGQFKKGHSGNPSGRPPKQREERFMEITLSAVTYADWKAIVKKACEQAKRGNSQARKFLADYLLGPPPQRHEITGKDGGALILEYVNDWRAHQATLPASGPDSGQD